MPRLAAIITLHCDGNTVAELAEFLEVAGRLGVDERTELLDGGHAQLAQDPHHLGEVAPHGAVHGTIGAVRRWLEEARVAGVADNAQLTHGELIAVDLDVVAIETGTCSDHVGTEPAALFISTDRACTDHLTADGVTVLAPTAR